MKIFGDLGLLHFVSDWRYARYAWIQQIHTDRHSAVVQEMRDARQRGDGNAPSDLARSVSNWGDESRAARLNGEHLTNQKPGSVVVDASTRGWDGKLDSPGAPPIRLYDGDRP